MDGMEDGIPKDVYSLLCLYHGATTNFASYFRVQLHLYQKQKM
jgi:hypothetical protein